MEVRGGRFGGWFDKYKKVQPYGGVEDGSASTEKATTPKYASIDWDVAPSREYFDELFRVSENQIIWGANYFHMPPTRCFVVWNKPNFSEKFSMAMCEYAWTSFDGNAKVFEHIPQGNKSDPRFHPTQKPVALYEWLLSRFAREGDRILDTHGGSMSSMIACHRGGFEATCIEIDEGYYEKAKARLIREQRQLSLF